MKFVARVVAATLVASMVWFSAAGEAMACSCIGTDDVDAFERSDAVFLGSLVKIIPPPEPIQTSADPETFRFEVDKVFRGDVPAVADVLTPLSGASCGLEISGPGPFLVFADVGNTSALLGNVEPDALTANLCGGTRLLSAGPLPSSFGDPGDPTSTTLDDVAADVAPESSPTDDGFGWSPLLLGAAFGLLAAIVFGLRRRRSNR